MIELRRPRKLSVLLASQVINDGVIMSELNNEDILAIYLIVNGPLQMSPGKIAAQAFQAAQRLFAAASSGQADSQLQALAAWQAQGTRTITRIAETDHIFQRACDELDGVVMIDEGMTEVPPDSATVFATWPLRRGDLPRMLRHKRVPLLDHCQCQSHDRINTEPGIV
jgi:peptidyl-tRNA hydrolase